MQPIDVDRDIMAAMQSNTGKSLLELSQAQPVMLVFLRHFGCTFCRAALAEISEKRTELEAGGTRIVFAHMSDESTASKYFSRYHLDNPVHISDPEGQYYQAFGLVRGSFNQLFGLSTWIRGFHEGVVNGHGIGPQLGDGFQMPGVFLIQDGEIRGQYIHKTASDKPDYLELSQRCQIP